MKRLAYILAFLLAASCGGGDAASRLLIGRTAGGGGGGAGNLEVGANLGTFQDYEITPIFTNPLHQGFGLIDLATAGSGDVPVAVDANECPNANFEAVTQSFAAGTTGTVLFRITGDFSSVAIRAGQVGDTVTSTGTYSSGTNTRDVTITLGSSRPVDSIRVQFSGTKKSSGGTPGEGVAGIIAARPGYTLDQVGTKRITDEFLTFVSNIKVLRLMDLELTNGSQNFGQGATFSKRPTLGPCSTGRSYREDMATPANAKINGIPLELMEALANEGSKDLWINIPFFAADAYVSSYAAHLHANLNAARKVYIEWVNEIWNSGGGFNQYTKAISQAASEVNGLWGPSVFHITDATNHWTSLDCNGAGTAINVTTASAHPYGSATTVIADGFGGFNLSSVVTTNIDATHFSIPATCTASASISYGEGAGIVDNATSSNLVAGTGTSKRILQARDKLVIRRIKEIGALWRTQVTDANMMTRYRPVFAWQGGVDQERDFWAQLTWLDGTYGGIQPVSYWLYAIAHAPYFNLDATRAGSTNIQTDSSAGLTVADYTGHLALTAKYAKKDYGFEAKAVAALHFNLESIMYEGGSDMQGDSGATNNAKKNTANTDAAMKQPYKDMITDTNRFGTNNTLYMEYFHNVARNPTDTNAGTNTWFWDATSITNSTDAKWAAMTESGGAARPTPTRNSGTGTFDCRQKHGNYIDIDPNLLTSTALPNFSSASLGATSHQQIYALWYETATTPQARTLTWTYTNNFAGWAIHIDVNGTRIASNVSLNNNGGSPNQTIGPYSFTSKPGFNGLEFIKASGGSGADTQCVNWIIN